VTYDLTLKPRSGTLDEQAVVDYFNDREGWEFPDDEAPELVAYENTLTGVYFQVYYDAAESTFTFSLNFFRPSPFALEADVELLALVDEFDLAVEDPQEQGIEGDRYDSDQFMRGWKHGNAFAYRTALADIEATPRTYDGEALENIWRWNYELELTAGENGGHYLAPPIGFVEHEGVAHSIFAFEPGHNMLVPRTDLVAIGDTIMPWRLLEDALELTGSDKIDDPVDYWAVLGTIAGRKVAGLAKQPSLDVVQLTLADVHALADVEAAT